jgi:hypothetical protein
VVTTLVVLQTLGSFTCHAFKALIQAAIDKISAMLLAAQFPRIDGLSGPIIYGS